jgi:hypothetical protein
MWLGWIYEGTVQEIYKSSWTIEKTIKESGVCALEDWLKQVDKLKYTRKWSNDHNVEVISATVTHKGHEYKVTVLGYWAQGRI